MSVDLNNILNFTWRQKRDAKRTEMMIETAVDY